jgi:hypothetical protein
MKIVRSLQLPLREALLFHLRSAFRVAVFIVAFATSGREEV